MPQDLNVMIQKIYMEAYNKGNLAVLDDIIAADYKRHQPPGRPGSLQRIH